MAYYRICSTDGANLDLGEVCADCAEKESQPDTTPPGKGQSRKREPGMRIITTHREVRLNEQYKIKLAPGTSSICQQ